MNWHLVNLIGFDVWAAGAALAVFYIVAGFVLFRVEDDLHLSVMFVVRSVLLVTCWPVFLAQYLTTARVRMWM